MREVVVRLWVIDESEDSDETHEEFAMRIEEEVCEVLRHTEIPCGVQACEVYVHGEGAAPVWDRSMTVEPE